MRNCVGAVPSGDRPRPRTRSRVLTAPPLRKRIIHKSPPSESDPTAAAVLSPARLHCAVLDSERTACRLLNNRPSDVNQPSERLRFPRRRKRAAQWHSSAADRQADRRNKERYASSPACRDATPMAAMPFTLNALCQNARANIYSDRRLRKIRNL